MEQEVPTTGIMSEAQQWPGNFWANSTLWILLLCTTRRDNGILLLFSYVGDMESREEKIYRQTYTTRGIVSFNIRYS